MSERTWLDRPWVAFDTETTGVDVENDHILSAAIVEISAIDVIDSSYHLLDWGIPIPEESRKVHGLTEEFLHANGGLPIAELEQIRDSLVEQLRSDAVLVGMNLKFDLTMLDRNCRHFGLRPLTDITALCAVDVFVLDKYADPYRKGSRRLEALAQHYRVPFHDAHDALADAVAAAKIAYRIGRLYPMLGELTPFGVHQLQIAEKKHQDASFKLYLVEQGKDATGVDGHWPLTPLAEPAPRPQLAVAPTTPTLDAVREQLQENRASGLYDGEEPPW